MELLLEGRSFLPGRPASCSRAEVALSLKIFDLAGGLGLINRWAASTGLAFALVARNPYQSFSQKVSRAVTASFR